MGSFCSPLSVLRFRTNIIVPLQYAIQANNYAKVQTGAAMKGKKKLKLGPIMEKKILPVETDPQKLVKFVCGSNILKEGQDVEIKPDSEYPDWLWNIHIGPPITLEEMDPSTKQYWRKVRKLGIKRNNLLASLKPF